MKKHTPEPWYYSGKDWFNGVGGKICGHTIKANNEDTAPQILGFFWYDCDKPEIKLDEVQLANAERVVACVNACVDIADPSAVGELLAALEEICRCFEELAFDANTCVYDDYITNAKAVIRRARGEQL